MSLGVGGGVGDRPRGAAALSPVQPSSAHLLVAGSQPLANRWALGRHSDEEANKGVVPKLVGGRAGGDGAEPVRSTSPDWQLE